jgi:hypothetical protein
MARVDPLERLGEPAPALGLEVRQDRLEVSLIAIAMRMLRLEEQGDLRSAVRNPVVRPLDHVVVRQPDALVASAEPRVAIGGLAEYVEAPEPRRGLSHPGLVRLSQSIAGFGERRGLVWRRDDADLEPGERVDDLVEPGVRHGDLEVFVITVFAAEKEVDRPAGRDVPGRVDPGE